MPQQDQTVILPTTDSLNPQGKMREDEISEQPEMFSAEDLDAARGELVKQMLAISREVANLQKEMSEIRQEQQVGEAIETLQDVSECNNNEAVDLSWANNQEARSERVRHEESEMSDDDARRTLAASPDSSHRGRSVVSPSLRRSSAYCETGKVDPHLPRRGIVWSPEVKDNAKAKGEDSLADTIKKRALRQRATHRGRSDGGIFIQTAFFCLLAFVLSGWLPKLAYQLVNFDSRDEADNDGDSDSFLSDGEF